jgi:hypothetical protein
MNARIILAPAMAGAEFPAGEQGDYARRWLVPFATRGPAALIANVSCEVGVAIAEDTVLPFTVTSGDERDNAYVVSPYTHYVSYLEEELRLIESQVQRSALTGVIKLLGRALRRGRIDRVVIVNNWLLSTNLYPAATHQQLAHITATLRERYPDHALLFRSLNRRTTQDVMQSLATLGFEPLISRRVYLFDSSHGALFRRKNFRRDHALIAQQGYRVDSLTAPTPEQAARIVTLYNALYLAKYSRHNPAFTSEFVMLAARERLLSIHALFKGSQMGFFARGGIMTTPLLGYDTAQPPQAGLYRMLTALLSQLARERGLFLHRSSGAATFKRSRGAEPELEYSMLDVRHLKAGRRAAWKLLMIIANKLGKPLLEKYDR